MHVTVDGTDDFVEVFPSSIVFTSGRVTSFSTITRDLSSSSFDSSQATSWSCSWSCVIEIGEALSSLSMTSFGSTTRIFEYCLSQGTSEEIVCSLLSTTSSLEPGILLQNCSSIARGAVLTLGDNSGINEMCLVATSVHEV